MSTLTGEGHSTIIQDAADLADYFQSFAKDEKNFRVGLEAEFFAVRKSTGKAVDYGGRGGIEAILDAMAGYFGYERHVEQGHVVGLKRGASNVALEPGGQVELSAPPVAGLPDIERQIQEFVSELRVMADRFDDLKWIAFGIQPFSSLNEISWVPKIRYQIMAEYLKARGSLSHWMMKKTATNQINFDYSGEQEAMDNLRTALGITSIASALFANSSFSEGRPNGFVSERLHIWNHTDPSRSGLIVEFTRPDRTFEDYLDYVLDMPLLFIIRNGQWLPVPLMNFRRFICDGFEGFHATRGDFELHLSTVFSEVRLKQFMEIRGMDVQKPELIPAVVAFWKGILYDREISREAWRLVDFADETDRLNLHHEVPQKGLKADLAGRPILPLARQLFELADAGLARQKEKFGMDERIFLERIKGPIIDAGKCPGEIVVEKWQRDFRKEKSRLIEYLSIE